MYELIIILGTRPALPDHLDLDESYKKVLEVSIKYNIQIWGLDFYFLNSKFGSWACMLCYFVILLDITHQLTPQVGQLIKKVINT